MLVLGAAACVGAGGSLIRHMGAAACVGAGGSLMGAAACVGAGSCSLCCYWWVTD